MKIDSFLKLLNILKNVYACDTITESIKVLSVPKNKANILKLLEQ